MSELLSHYYVKQGKSKTLILTDINENILGNLKLKSHIKKQGILNIQDTTYTILQPNLWYQNFEIYKADTKIGTIEMNWKSEAKIILDSKHTFSLELMSLWNMNYKMHNSKNELIYFIQPKFVWSKMNYEFNISYHEIYNEYNNKEFLFFLGTFIVMVNFKNSNPS